ncbi:hypothetical protein [uncultured Microbulbifer sp.]|uniref:hypothetical protein n=1 Tax=uncultured Microbulbifer sp. TaxID=348147 RepID=UPI0026126FE8|nr:hypothetical protein [uncultured Microbulbifer sp.]
MTKQGMHPQNIGQARWSALCSKTTKNIKRPFPVNTHNQQNGLTSLPERHLNQHKEETSTTDRAKAGLWIQDPKHRNVRKLQK